jgi:hypothetical protein
MTGNNAPLLINLVGHAAGALIFGIFLCLLFSGRGWSGSRGRTLSGLAAALSLLWNVGSLVILSDPGMTERMLNIALAVTFAVLSLLPAVLLHISLENSEPRIVAAGYVLSGIAIAMHFWEIRGNGPALHQVAILLITGGFLALTAIAAVRTAARRPGSARIVVSMCLALFAMSFLHFGSGHPGQAWSAELIVHHAGIPLALFVLLQDYRFVLVDAFVRFLANVLLAATITWLAIDAAPRILGTGPLWLRPIEEAKLLIGICLFLVFFAWLRGHVQALLTHAVFRQHGLAQLPARIKDSPPFADESQLLAWTAAAIATAAETEQHALIEAAAIASGRALHAPVIAATLPDGALDDWDWAEALVPIRLGQGNSRVILLGRRRGGRRYLAGDLDALARAAAEAAEKFEALRREEMHRLVAQADLRALQSQINPHFLFNSLNALYGAIPREAGVARRMTLNLAEIFRYLLRTGKNFVPLSEEMRIIRAYLEIEQRRIGSRLEVEIQVDDAVLDTPIPVLSVQPLVENAIKHGVAASTGPGFVRIRAARRDGELLIAVENSSGGPNAGNGGAGLGLQNVRRRLEICYGSASELRLEINEGSALAELSIPAATAAAL